MSSGGMQADGSWVHPHDGQVLQVQSAAYHNLSSSLSDTMEMMEFTLQPGLTGIHCLETGDQDLELRVRVYDDTGYCLASYISEENGDGTSMELESGRLYTVKVERRYADSGAFCLRWWMQKEQEDITNYGSVNDTIEFSQQVNVYQFRCAAAAACQVLCTSADPDLRLSIHIYDEYGNRINSGIGVERGFGPSADLEVGKTYTIHVNSYTGYGNYSLAVKKAG